MEGKQWLKNGSEWIRTKRNEKELKEIGLKRSEMKRTWGRNDKKCKIKIGDEREENGKEMNKIMK